MPHRFGPTPARLATVLASLALIVAGVAAYAQGHSGDAGSPPPVQDPNTVPTVGNPIRVLHHAGPGNLSPVVYPWNGTLTYNDTYDLTITAIDAQYADPSSGATYQLVSPSGALVGSPRQASNDTEHCGQASGDYSWNCTTPTAYANLTFVGVRMTEAGAWTVKASGGNATLAMFSVAARAELAVTLSRSNATYDGSAPFSLVIHVANATGGPVAGATLTSTPRNALFLDGLMTDAAGNATLVRNGTPPAGSYAIQASKSVTPNATYDVTGSATFVVTAGAPKLVASDAVAQIGGYNVTAVTLQNASDLGTITFTLAYDPSVVAVTNVSTPMADATLSWRANNSTLTVTVATSDVPGPGGSVTAAWVTLHAVGLSGSSSALHLGVPEAAHSDGSTFTPATQDGTFRVTLLGDVNGDGIVDLRDVQATADTAVGQVVPGFQPGSADVNRDGRVTGVDAMMIRQYVMGTRASLG